MNKHRKSIIVLTTNSFLDPLFYATVVVYLKEINQQKAYNFHIISFEQDKYKLSKKEYTILDEELKEFNIHRYSYNWSNGKFLLIKKFFEFFKAFFKVFVLYFKHRPRAIFALANIAGAYSYIFAKLLRIKLIVFTFEPHSEFMRDCGVWSPKSLKFILLNKMEYLMGKNANYIATGTIHMVERLKNLKTNAKVYRVPSCIDENLHVFDNNARNTIRQKLNITNKNVFIYLGKFGDLYYKEEIAILCSALQNNINDCFFMILTPNNKDEVQKMFEKHLVSSKNLYIDCVGQQDVAKYLSASDMGIVAVPPLESQKFRSPIKVGEYLAVGIPYIVCKGVSEDDIYAKNFDVGIVLNNFSFFEIAENVIQIEKYLIEDKSKQRERCRKVGIDYRSKQIAINAFTEIFSEVCN